MKTLRTLLIIFIATAAIWACKKDEPGDPVAPTPSGPNASVFSQLFANNIAGATRTFSVNAAAGGQVMSPRGTQLDFEPGAFTHENGSPVTGTVEVFLVEALTIGDMIWLNKQTVGNDNGTLRILKSGGAINVYARQGSTPLRITNEGLIAKIPTSEGDPAMELFRGNEDAAGNMIWDRIDSGIVDVDSAYYDSTDYTYTFPYYFYYSLNGNTNLNWINCDLWWNAPNTTTIDASIPTGQSPDSTLVWLALPSVNGSISMWRNDPTSAPQTYHCSQVVPIGTQAVVVGLKQDATGYSSSFTPITVAIGLDVPMTFSPTTLQQFHDDVNAL